MPGTAALAYGWSEDHTPDGRYADTCRRANERSLRHAHMNEEERRADDYAMAWQWALRQREINRACERARYMTHYVEKNL